MENNKAHETGETRSDTGEQGLNLSVLEQKWGVSRQELTDAIQQVGTDRSDIEEYLLNKRWKKAGSEEQPSFQKRDLNEEETY